MSVLIKVYIPISSMDYFNEHKGWWAVLQDPQLKPGQELHFYRSNENECFLKATVVEVARFTDAQKLKEFINIPSEWDEHFVGWWIIKYKPITRPTAAELVGGVSDNVDRRWSWWKDLFAERGLVILDDDSGFDLDQLVVKSEALKGIAACTCNWGKPAKEGKKLDEDQVKDLLKRLEEEEAAFWKRKRDAVLMMGWTKRGEGWVKKFPDPYGGGDDFEGFVLDVDAAIAYERAIA